MERRRAVMIDTRTGQPLDPTWRPMLALEELGPANDLMQKNSLCYQWQWAPSTQQLCGVVQLSTCG
jgi:hypothetical protein